MLCQSSYSYLELHYTVEFQISWVVEKTTFATIIFSLLKIIAHFAPFVGYIFFKSILVLLVHFKNFSTYTPLMRQHCHNYLLGDFDKVSFKFIPIKIFSGTSQNVSSSSLLLRRFLTRRSFLIFIFTHLLKIECHFWLLNYHGTWVRTDCYIFLTVCTDA